VNATAQIVIVRMAAPADIEISLPTGKNPTLSANGSLSSAKIP